jgi:hypothetical protein
MDESEIRKLIANHFLSDCAVLQWHPAAEEDIPTPNMIVIVVFSSFFHCGFDLPTCNFLRGLPDHYRIELIQLNPNFILRIIVLVHLCEAFLGISPNFPLFKTYFFLKYQSSVTNQKVIGDLGLQTRPCTGFLDLPLKSFLQGSHGTWFYCKKHKPSLPPFVARLPEFQGTWSEEPTPLELTQVTALTNKVNLLKEKDLTGVCVATH